jgi:hypothetical protein
MLQVLRIGPFGLSSCFKAETYELLDARRSGGLHSDLRGGQPQLVTFWFAL